MTRTITTDFVATGTLVTAARAPRRPRSFVTALALSSGIFGDDSAETLTTEKSRRRASIPTFLSPPNRLHLRHCQLRRRQPSRRLRQSLRLLIIGGDRWRHPRQISRSFPQGRRASFVVLVPLPPRPRTQRKARYRRPLLLLFCAVWLPSSSASILFYRVSSGRRLASSRLLPTGRRREVIIGTVESSKFFYDESESRSMINPLTALGLSHVGLWR